MIHNYVPKRYYTVTSYEVVFDDGCNNGYGFPCDKDGNFLENSNPCAKKNYEWCLNNPDKFVRFNQVVKYERRTWDNAHGTCDCGNDVELYNEYCGACQCNKCGQWYNLFGQKLLPPKCWEEDY